MLYLKAGGSKMLDMKELDIRDEELDEYSSELIEAIDNGATLKDVHGVSNDVMRDIYKLAYDFYHQGKLNDAESLFRFLYIYDFYNPEYAMGLAAVLQLKKNFSKAIDFYALSFSLSKDDYRPVFHAGHCNLMLRKSQQAKMCFESVINNSKDEELKERASIYLNSINHSHELDEKSVNIT